ncbi:MAG: RidA family protein [Desulfobacteraceae bacterium]|nr:RidA family protein [Desulfobacteraceae bacterium]
MREVVKTEKAPKAIGPYSQAIKTGGLLFVSGQIPLDPETGELVGTDIVTQTRKVLDNLKAVIKAGSSELENVAKCTCFLADMNDFTAFNDVYKEYFGIIAPARECIAAAGLPKGARVEVSAICCL